MITKIPTQEISDSGRQSQVIKEINENPPYQILNLRPYKITIDHTLCFIMVSLSPSTPVKRPNTQSGFRLRHESVRTSGETKFIE